MAPVTPTPIKKKRKHTTLTIAKKIEIVKRLERGEKACRISLDYGVGTSTISDIKKQAANLKKYVSSAETMFGCEKRKTMRKPKLMELNESV